MSLDTLNNGDSGLDARTKINAAIAAVNGIQTPLRAYIETTGNDSTGAVGDPSKPFASMSAAYDAGARVFVFGVGSFAGLSRSVQDSIHLIGQGAQSTIVGDITFGPSDFSNSFNVSGGGRNNITVGSVSLIGTDGTGYPATSAQSGTDMSGATLGVSGISSSGNILIQAGNGGPGGPGTDDPSFPGTGEFGGSGGGGGTIIVTDCIIAGSIITQGGTGGVGGPGGASPDASSPGAPGGNGGNGGNGNGISVNFSSVGGLSAINGAGGTGGDGGYGGMMGGPGTPGSPGGAASISTMFTQSATSEAHGESTTYRASLIGGSWNA